MGTFKGESCVPFIVHYPKLVCKCCSERLALHSGSDLVLHVVNKTYCIEYQQRDMVTFRSAIVMHEIMASIG